MGRASRRPTDKSAVKSKQRPGRPANKPAKKPTNLTLDPEAVSRGERFARRHGTSLSQLVTGLLYSLPAAEEGDILAQLTPVVRRLYGVAEGARADRDTYRDHLVEKYGGR